MTSAPDTQTNSPRTVYRHSTLDEVVCQLRFPAILRIAAELPAGFQDRIRRDFPLFDEQDSEALLDYPAEVRHLLRSSLPPHQGARRIWSFRDETEAWSVTLTRESVALSTTCYPGWPRFRELFGLALDALVEEYAPGYFSRSGLRYINLIDRAELQLPTSSWSDLFQPWVAAGFQDAELAKAIRETSHRTLMVLPGDIGFTNLRHGTGRIEGKEELGYILDADFFTEEKLEVIHVLDRLDLFNREAGRLFRRCISDKLHEAMEPENRFR